MLNQILPQKLVLSHIYALTLSVLTHSHDCLIRSVETNMHQPFLIDLNIPNILELLSLKLCIRSMRMDKLLCYGKPGNKMCVKFL